MRNLRRFLVMLAAVALLPAYPALAADGPIVTAPGSFQSELGCAGDWMPECRATELLDPDGDGVYTFSTTGIPAGSHEVKIAHGLSWAENYGAGGARDGANIAFFVGADGDRTDFSYVLATHVLTVSAGVAPPNLREARAQWLERGLIAMDLPTTRPAGRSGCTTHRRAV